MRVICKALMNTDVAPVAWHEPFPSLHSVTTVCKIFLIMSSSPRRMKSCQMARSKQMAWAHEEDGCGKQGDYTQGRHYTADH